MSTTDLTRWNRAGLSRFRYVDANAATHLEALRIELAARFAQWAVLQYEAQHEETATERTARMLKQYRADRSDWAWEETRAFARALHILTEHVDAFANEGYLRTATQWPSVRRLAAMVGYVPAPASSATTPLVLLAKGEAASATVKRGFAVKHVPAGAPPVIFETLEDIDIAPGLNALRLTDWNKNPTVLDEAAAFASAPAGGAPPLWSIPKGIKASAGGWAILTTDQAATAPAPIPALPVTIASTDGAALTIAATPAALPGVTFAAAFAARPGLTFDTALLHVAPSQALVPILNGADVVRVSSPHELVAGDVVAWKPGGTGTTTFAKVLATDTAALRLQVSGGTALPAPGTALFRAALIPFAQFTANNSEWRLSTRLARSSDFRVTFADPSGELQAGIALTSTNAPEANVPGGTSLEYRTLIDPALTGTTQIWFTDPGKDKPAALVAADLLPSKTTTLEFDGKPPGLASGDLVVLQILSGATSAYATNRIARIEKDAGSYRLIFAAALPGSVAAVQGVFAATLRPAGHNVDPRPIPSLEFDLQVGRGADWPALLSRNRRLVFESASGVFPAFAAKIASYDADQGTIRIDPAVADPTGIPRGDVMIRANVVDAGHGETKPVRVLGSGNASTTNQRFVIDVEDVSHVRDVSMPGGVRADVQVEIEREIYSQVATLRDSDPAAPNYVARITEAGTLELEFGDGQHGRRLPSASNNVLATIRRGSGLDGNLPAAALTDIAKKHPAIDGFLQPIAATGGDDREALDQIRQSAPGRLAAMDRAISVADYQQLAQRFQGVWHAAAFEQPAFGRSREAVRIVIVPAGGGPLGALADDIRGYLIANGLAYIDVAIEPFAALPVEIKVTARVDSIRYDPREIETRVRAALIAAFDLRLRRPGQPFYRSEVTRVVENTDGVSNSDVVLFASAPPGHEPDWDRAARGDDQGIWAVFPKDNQVIYAAMPALINVATTEATI